MEGRKLTTLMSSLRDLIFFQFLQFYTKIGSWADMEPESSRQEQLIPEDAISPSLTQAETQCPSSANTCTFHHPFSWAAPARRENLVSPLLLNSFWAQIGCV